ncbi:MAG TPA: hypothetical protein VN881_05900 [Candidatus Acidoferrales bacterium]|jgi:hypothetical protein|nr:hypothetical protein [Candidatus Acidoferrales bacterium]
MHSPITPLAPSAVQQQEQQAEHEKYLHRMLVGLDQFLNVVTDGDPDETISARSARAAEKGRPWGLAMCKFLNVFQKNHGPKAQAGDVARADAVLAAEDGSGGFDKP